MKRLACGLLAIALLAACGEEKPRTQVMARVLAEPGVTATSTRARIRVWSGAVGADLTEQLDQEIDLAERPFPIRVAIVPVDDDATRRFRLEAQGLDSSGTVISTARVLSGFIAERTLELVVVLRDSCAGDPCTEDETCDTDGSCRSAIVDPDTLPTYDDRDAGPREDAGPDAGPDVDAGPDAGPVDAGFDGGPDAGPQDGGRSDGGPVDGGCEEGTVCGMPDTTLGTCTFGTTCTTMGSQSRTVETPTCMAGSCQIVITTDSVGCTRPSTDGTMCAATNTTDGPCMFASTCTTSGTLTRTVETSTCVGGSCSTGTTTSSVACTRGSRNGVTCGTTTTSDSACTRTAPCGTAGTFVRTTTTRTCSGGTCGSTPSTMTRACTLPAVPDSTTCSGGYCCSGACVPRNHVNHCGVCGMNCALRGRACVNAISNNGGRHNLSPPQYVCDCIGFQNCRDIGYGPVSTCFDGHCQCQCPASGPTTCTGQCRTGTCFEDTIEPMSDNFCGY